MSELEKRQRDEYQKNRQKWIFIEMIVAAALVLATIFTLIPYTVLNNNTYVYYAENGRAESRVYLADNSFYKEEYLGADHAYVSELIDHIETDFKYALAMDAAKVDYKYSYKVEATVNVIDNDSKAPLYDPSFVLKEVKNAESSKNQLSISEKINIDYAEYNKLAEDFVNTFDVKNATAKLVVRMTVSVLGKSETFIADKSNTYTMTVSAPLLKQTVKLTAESSVPSGEQKILACDGVEKVVFLVLWIVFLCLSVLAIAFMICFIILTRDKHIDYARRVQKLLSSYKSYIQRISNPFDYDGYKILNVVTFAELLEISDKLQNPVLMYENEDKTRSDFFISTCNNIIYLYVVEVEEDPEDYIIEPTVEPTIEEPEIITEPEPEIITEPEPEGVEAIDIRWENDDRTYRYDPNGEVVDEGDIVLVPTTIEHVGEVEREAEVARGNYRIPADEIKTPLKKIIAVVKRKMQSLVTPSGEKIDK